MRGAGGHRGACVASGCGSEFEELCSTATEGGRSGVGCQEARWPSLFPALVTHSLSLSSLVCRSDPGTPQSVPSRRAMHNALILSDGVPGMAFFRRTLPFLSRSVMHISAICIGRRDGGRPTGSDLQGSQARRSGWPRRVSEKASLPLDARLSTPSDTCRRPPCRSDLPVRHGAGGIALVIDFSVAASYGFRFTLAHWFGCGQAASLARRSCFISGTGPLMVDRTWASFRFQGDCPNSERRRRVGRLQRARIAFSRLGAPPTQLFGGKKISGEQGTQLLRVQRKSTRNPLIWAWPSLARYRFCLCVGGGGNLADFGSTSDFSTVSANSGSHSASSRRAWSSFGRFCATRRLSQTFPNQTPERSTLWRAEARG